MFQFEIFRVITHLILEPKRVKIISRVSTQKIEWNRVNHQSENLTLVPPFFVFASFEFQVLIFTKIKSAEHQTWSLFNKVHVSVWKISCYYPSHFRTEASEESRAIDWSKTGWIDR